jgi:serine/threonine-protein kinase
VSASTRIGRYEIERPLARGGMAELFVARLVDDEGFARRVAVKRALPELARDRAFAEMFRSEARLAASLAHHNIVAVHDLGEDGVGFYFVMELLHGADVGALLREAREPIPIPIVLAIAMDACAGLHHAHERRDATGAILDIVHRDVSPQNLFVTLDGCTKLLDFGIAKAIDKLADRQTRTGTLRGKVPYMSPEQCRGEQLDRRTDVFSLGIVIWELVTGERLYGADGESDFEVWKQIADRDAPEVTTRRPDAPAALSRVISNALARDRESRYPTIARLHDDLDAVGRVATAREVGAYVAATFPDRADAWLRGTLSGRASSAPPPRVTAPLPGGWSGSTHDAASSAIGPALPRARDTTTRSATPRRATSRWRLSLLVLGSLAATSIAGYSIGTCRGAPQLAARPGDDAARTAPIVQPREDAQWFQPDDYLVSDEPYVSGRLDRIRLAKAVGRAPVTGSSAHFIDAVGRELDTATYWATRIAVADDLAVGRLAFCHAVSNLFEGTTPTTRDDARLGEWMVARINDVGELPVAVRVGGVACPVAALRVAR